MQLLIEIKPISWSRPHGARGLKSVKRYKARFLRRSRPHGARGLKYRQKERYGVLVCSRARTGRVD